MKLTSVLNTFRKNGLNFEQVGATPVYKCEHALVKKTHVQVLVQADGVTVSSMAIVHDYKQGETKTYFRTIREFLAAFLDEIERAEKRSERLNAQVAAQEIGIKEVANDVVVDRELFRVERVRHNVTSGSVTVFYKDIEIATFEDEIEFAFLKGASFGYNQVINGCGSFVSDDEYIELVLRSKIVNKVKAVAQDVEVDRELFQVIRVRKNNKQGEAIVCYAGVEIARFDEEYVFSTHWDVLEPHTDVIDGYASDISDSSYINATMRSKLKNKVMDVAAELAAEAAAEEQKTTHKESYVEGFQVVRNRISATQGEATVYYYGIEVATFGDEIDYINVGEPYYGEMNSRWASRVPDEKFIEAVKSRLPKKLAAILATQVEIEREGADKLC